MENQRQITFEEGQEFASQNDMQFIETSAKATQNIDKSFQTIILEIIEKNGIEYLDRIHVLPILETNKQEAYHKMEILY